MKSKKKTTTKSKPKWVKLSNGIHNHEGQFIRKGEFLYAEEWEIPEGIKKSYKLVSKVRASKEPPAKGITMIQSLVKGKYDIVNENTGDRLNDDPLTKKEAEEFIEGMSNEKSTVENF